MTFGNNRRMNMRKNIENIWQNFTLMRGKQLPFVMSRKCFHKGGKETSCNTNWF
jgi:hypothetical protein